MCTALIAYRSIAGFELVVAHNRDEFYRRPARPAEFWPDRQSILAGRDLESDGTWLGVSRSAKVGLVTNYRMDTDHALSGVSRGSLVPGYLTGTQTSLQYARHIHRERDRYRPFSAIFFDSHGCHFVSSHSADLQAIAPGFHGLSNHLLNTPWPKVTEGIAKLRSLSQHMSSSQDPDHLVQTLLDYLRHPQPTDGTAFNSSRSVEQMRAGPENRNPQLHAAQSSAAHDPRSLVFQCTGEYGTRASTVICVTQHGLVRFAEHCWDASGALAAQRNHQWELIKDAN